MTILCRIARLLLFGFLMATAIGCKKESVPKPSPMDLYHFSKHGELQFLNPEGENVVGIDIEIADTEHKIVLGLMFRRSMHENQGMLFIFPDSDYRSFWMKNTYFSLDMFFVDQQGVIRTIRRETLPLSENTYTSEMPAKYVVEVVGGFAKRHGIEPGYSIEWRRLPD
ncbi:DUF192 domain-containing protein [candidate division KSB1 bacterium]|nr:DUF192 domain-containing protein [candidate division KSB1 bacterium]